MIKENKFSKYLLYAIGEIILVVIGILIALQINNANENSKEQQVLTGYLNNISKNVTSDLIKIAQLQKFRDSSRIGSQLFSELAQKEQITIEELEQYTNIYLVRYNAFFDEYFNADKSGFESLKSSGFLSKIQGTKIESLLLEYYNLVGKIEIEETSLNNFIEQMEYEMFKNGTVLNFIDALKMLRKDKSKKTLAVIHEYMKTPAFRGANYITSRQKSISNLYTQLQVVGKEIFTNINYD